MSRTLGLAAGSIVVLCTGCRVLVELVEADERDSDLAPDAAVIDPSCEPWDVTPAGLDPCQLPAATAPLALDDGVWTYDTNSGALTDPDQDASFPTSALVVGEDGVEVRVLSVTSFELTTGAVLELRGRRPLLVLSASTATVGGVIDATSRSGVRAAGADPATCVAAEATRGADDLEGAGGGGGGGHGTAGAAGGSGNDGAALGGSGGSIVAGASLRGGCPGAPGGNALGGPGGAGGGAVMIAARELVEVDGTIVAGGGGGGASQGARSGGGGGGAGGFVGISAASIVLGPAAILAANGGGGGGGSDGNPALPGEDGQPSSAPAAGGGGQGMGAGGGAGGALDASPSTGLLARRGGGGGGGGVGQIVLDSPEVEIATGATISP